MSNSVSFSKQNYFLFTSVCEWLKEEQILQVDTIVQSDLQGSVTLLDYRAADIQFKFWEGSFNFVEDKSIQQNLTISANVSTDVVNFARAYKHLSAVLQNMLKWPKLFADELNNSIFEGTFGFEKQVQHLKCIHRAIDSWVYALQASISRDKALKTELSQWLGPFLNSRIVTEYKAEYHSASEDYFAREMQHEIRHIAPDNQIEPQCWYLVQNLKDTQKNISLLQEICIPGGQIHNWGCFEESHIKDATVSIWDRVYCP